MDYEVKLEIGYDYASPAEASRTLLRMLPRSGPGQSLMRGLVTADPPPAHQSAGTDFFGNTVTEMVYDHPLTSIAFRFAGRVRREAEEGELDFSTPLDGLAAEIAGVASVGPDAPHHFTAPSPRAAPDAAITAFLREAIAGERTALGAVRAASRALNGVMGFDPTASDVTTEPATAFAARSGVCQDFSHILIAGLRAVGIPAGYVSGFLRTEPPPGQPRLEGADAMHAWVRAWVGAEAGWVEIDPTNDMTAGDDHIVVAYGRDYSDVAPVKGAIRSAGPQSTRHGVDMVPVS